MGLPIRSPVSLPARVVGSPLLWALKGAQLGATAMLTLLAIAAIAVGEVPPLVGVALFTVAPTVVGGAFGAVAPAVLERLRGRVPLWLLVPAQGVVGAAGGCLAALGRELLFGWHPPDRSLWLIAGALVGGVTVAIWWLPFTVATVLGRRWPVTTVAGVLGPLSVWATVRLLLG